jgi:uncharacterized protein YfdQ (DUF2303 family)
MMLEDQIRTEFDAAFQAGLAQANAFAAPGGIPTRVLPDGYSQVSCERFLTKPIRVRADVALSSADSFCAYIKGFGSDATRLFAAEEKHRVVAVLDYHGATGGSPGWGEHRATLTLTLSPEWKTWIGKDGQRFTQEQFAEFLEDNLPDIAEPEGAVVLEAAKHLQATKTVHFKSAINLANGSAALQYEESVESKGKGQITIPTELMLGLRPYEHGPLYKVTARPRHRIDADKLTFLFKLDRPHKVIEAAFDEMLAHVEETTGMKPLLGAVTIPDI